MPYHYLYKRTQRRSAVTLLINIVVILGMFCAGHHFLGGSEEGREILFWINLAVPLVVTGLFLLAAYFWRSNGTFRVAVDDSHFEIFEPFVLGTSFRVPIGEIVEIRHVHEKMSGHSSIRMKLQSGERHRITMNRSFSRRKLYAALAMVNPAIQLPEHPLLFPQA